jgi:RNA polymerase sigma factor (sigma-70 family)
MVRDKTQRDILREIGRRGTRESLVRTAKRVLSEHESEDAAHDAIVQALAAAASFRQDSQVGTWLYRIVFNAALMEHRRSRRARQALARVGGLQGALAGEAGQPSSAAVVEDVETRSLLREAVSRLPTVYREVIERCVYDEQDAEHVAGDLGISRSAVRTRISRARDKLREIVADSSASSRRPAA